VKAVIKSFLLLALPAACSVGVNFQESLKEFLLYLANITRVRLEIKLLGKVMN
jgi:hypothetical protein